MIQVVQTSKLIVALSLSPVSGQTLLKLNRGEHLLAPGPSA